MDNIASRSQSAEADYLAKTISFAEQELSRARTSSADIKSAIITAKKELRENTTHTIGSLWGSEAFEALAALNQYANPINDKIIEFEENENKIIRLEHIVKKPYFARIDFLYYDDLSGEEKFYIGRTSLKDNKSHEMYVYDWRSPIASVFYRFANGEAFYDAPGGRVLGVLTFKRQYEIRDGAMEYYFDADVQIVDEFLRKLLAQNTSSQMKSIVETIQKEQDIIIRDLENDLMMVQGVAGSGKTSIALHRAAYLMYQGLANRLMAHNILIISPNSLFEQYIAQVLPDLGEENVTSAVFEEIAAKVLGYKKIQTRDQFLEKMLVDNNSNSLSTLIAYKTSLAFADIIDYFIAEIPNFFIEIKDIDYAGQSIMSAKQIQHKLSLSSSSIPLGVKLKQIEEYIMETVQSYHRIYHNQEELRQVKKKIKGFTYLDVKALYRYLFTDRYCLKNFLSAAPPEIIKATINNFNSKTIAYDDIAAMLYLKLKLHSADAYKNIRQVVVDEAQDYYPLQYKIFKLLFSKAKYTILGDYNQTLEKEEDVSLYNQISKIFEKPKSVFVTMDKSFRSTNEIIQFSTQFLPNNIDIKSFNRSGEIPQLHSAETDTILVEKLAQEAKRLLDAGYQSIGLICKTASNAKVLYHDLKDLIEVKLIKAGTENELKGIFIIPVYLAKGLEFDAVLLCDGSRENYHQDKDKHLLYVACTRALHFLGIYGVGELAFFIGFESCKARHGSEG